MRNAALLLELLSQGPPFQQLTDLAERSGLSLPTVHRLLRSLVAAGLAEQDPDSARYGLGPELVRLSERYLARLPVIRTMTPYLVELRNSTGATVTGALLLRGFVVYVNRIDGEDIGLFRDWSRMRPAAETAAGRVLLAHVSRPEWKEAMTAPAGPGPTFTDADRKLWAASEYVVVSDALGRSEVAVPVLDGDGRPLASIAAAASAQRFSDDVLAEQVAPELSRAATAIARALGDA